MLALPNEYFALNQLYLLTTPVNREKTHLNVGPSALAVLLVMLLRLPSTALRHHCAGEPEPALAA